MGRNKVIQLLSLLFNYKISYRLDKRSIIDNLFGNNLCKFSLSIHTVLLISLKLLRLINLIVFVFVVLKIPKSALNLYNNSTLPISLDMPILSQSNSFRKKSIIYSNKLFFLVQGSKTIVILRLKLTVRLVRLES